MNQAPQTSIHCNLTTAILQIVEGSHRGGTISVDGRSAAMTEAWMILPKPNGLSTCACPLNYFQTDASLREGWINDDNRAKVSLTHLKDLSSVDVSIGSQRGELLSGLSNGFKARLLAYFAMDVYHNEAAYRGFCCYAFVSFVTDSTFKPQTPPFEYQLRTAHVGEIIVLANDGALPDSIKHWALCVGNNLFLSKFGLSGMGSDALVAVSQMQQMLQLYNCTRWYVAKRTPDAPGWEKWVPVG